MSNVSFMRLFDFSGCEFSIAISEYKSGPYIESILTIKSIIYKFLFILKKYIEKNISPEARKRR